MSSLPIVLVCQAVLLAGMLTVVLDQYAHKRVQTVGGVNTWGYRGEVLRQRQPRDVRVAVVGGDLAFGWGVSERETVPAYLQSLVAVQVQTPGEERRPVTVAGLGALGLPAAGYAARISRFRDLRPDVICLYVDLVDTTPMPVLPPGESGIYQFTGYVPMLPLVLAEKGQYWQDDGARARGWLLQAVGGLMRSADQGLARLPPAAVPEWPSRAEAVAGAVDAAVATASGVVLVLPAPRNRDERRAHANLRAMAEPRLGTMFRLRLVDLDDHPRLHDDGLRLDGKNYGAEGHSLTAAAMLPAVLDLLGVERVQ